MPPHLGAWQLGGLGDRIHHDAFQRALPQFADQAPQQKILLLLRHVAQQGPQCMRAPRGGGGADRLRHRAQRQIDLTDLEIGERRRWDVTQAAQHRTTHAYSALRHTTHQVTHADLPLLVREKAEQLCEMRNLLQTAGMGRNEPRGMYELGEEHCWPTAWKDIYKHSSAERHTRRLRHKRTFKANMTQCRRRESLLQKDTDEECSVSGGEGHTYESVSTVSPFRLPSLSAALVISLSELAPAVIGIGPYVFLGLEGMHFVSLVVIGMMPQRGIHFVPETAAAAAFGCTAALGMEGRVEGVPSHHRGKQQIKRDKRRV